MIITMDHSPQSTQNTLFNRGLCFFTNRILENEAAKGSNFMASPFTLTCGPLLSFVNGAWLYQRFTLKSSFEEIVKGPDRAELQDY
ncbi:hypothetical protein FEM48_Zijuj05G0075100 [Ziziphus jujuba var. spinosa]|uniref:Uncharacterized protein n=1 Tax=Ziziphus jujuba var. spinosa TaxID=714518 RepID=A0A978VDM7_ZIZJJ|nr:hypothetical protein FEM48_Zijuj05G0075100 [Ziziphus jujuba var. spinosa]